MATAWLVLCLRKQHAAAPLSIVLLGNVLAALVGLPFMFEAMPDPVSWLALLLSGVVQLGVPVMLYCKAIAHVRAIEAVLIPIIEPLLNPLFLLLGEVPECLDAGRRGHCPGGSDSARARDGVEYSTGCEHCKVPSAAYYTTVMAQAPRGSNPLGVLRVCR